MNRSEITAGADDLFGQYTERREALVLLHRKLRGLGARIESVGNSLTTDYRIDDADLDAIAALPGALADYRATRSEAVSLYEDLEALGRTGALLPPKFPAY